MPTNNDHKSNSDDCIEEPKGSTDSKLRQARTPSRYFPSHKAGKPLWLDILLRWSNSLGSTEPGSQLSPHQDGHKGR